jgi:hypothetical protein
VYLCKTGSWLGAVTLHSNLDHWLAEVGENGFTKAEGLVPLALTEALVDTSDELLRRPAEDWDQAHYFYESKNWRPTHFSSVGKASTYFDFLGESPKLDDAVCSLLSIPAVEQVLAGMLGQNYRLWYACIRRAEAHCSGLPIHQDIQGETGLCLLMSDTFIELATQNPRGRRPQSRIWRN